MSGLMGGVVLFVGWAFKVGNFFKTGGSGRWDMYRVFMGEWWNHGPRLFGYGLGSFKILSPGINMSHNLDARIFYPWLHSDILQVIWELGLVGFVLYTFSAVYTLYHLFRDKNQAVAFSVVCGLLSAMIFDFPIRYFPMAFLLGLFAVRNTNKQPNFSKNYSRDNNTWHIL